MNVTINGGWPYNFEGRNLTFRKNSSNRTFSVIVEGPFEDKPVFLSERIEYIKPVCKLTWSQHKIKIIGPSDAAPQVLKKLILASPLLDGYKDKWVPQVENFLSSELGL